VTADEGIEVSRRAVPGREFPVLRAVGSIDANLYEVLAVILDVAHHPRWMHNCSEARLLHAESEYVAHVYNRTDSPWPVADRDAVLRTETVVVEPGRELLVRFVSEPDTLFGEVQGVVRMAHLEGSYRLNALAPDRTRVEYRVDADPAGQIPAWLVRRSTRDLALRTLLKLRERVSETRGSHGEFRDRWDPSRRKLTAPTENH
jgi:hypothetical protein